VPMAGGGSGVAERAAEGARRMQQSIPHNRLSPPDRRCLATSGIWVATGRVYAWACA